MGELRVLFEDEIRCGGLPDWNEPPIKKEWVKTGYEHSYNDWSSPKLDPYIWIQIRMPYPAFWMAGYVYGASASPYDRANPSKGEVGAMVIDTDFCIPIDDALEEFRKKLPSQRDPHAFFRDGENGYGGRTTNLFSNYPTGKFEEKALKQGRRKQFNKLAKKYPTASGLINKHTNKSTWQKFEARCEEIATSPYQEIEYTVLLGVGVVEDWSDYQQQRNEGIIPSY